MVRYTVLERCEGENNIFLPNGDYYAFASFNIPKQIRETIKRKYIEAVRHHKYDKQLVKQQTKKQEQNEINRINDNLNNTL